MSGLTDRWPAIGKWTPSYFADQFGHEVVRANLDLPTSGVPYERPDPLIGTTLGEVVARIGRGERCSVSDQATLPWMRGDYDFAPLLPDGRQTDSQAALAAAAEAYWIGAYTRSGLHWDPRDNLLAQVYGRKRVLMVSAEQSRHVYPTGRNVDQSAVDPDAPDLRAHPLWHEATRYEGVIAPGDVLVIPRGWWHYICAIDVSISLNCYFNELMSFREFGRILRSGGPRAAARVARDFVWHGVLARPYQERLLSSPPTGLQLYRFLRGLPAWDTSAPELNTTSRPAPDRPAAR